VQLLVPVALVALVALVELQVQVLPVAQVVLVIMVALVALAEIFMQEVLSDITMVQYRIILTLLVMSRQLWVPAVRVAPVVMVPQAVTVLLLPVVTVAPAVTVALPLPAE
jgi:hypothetical protein